MRDNYYNELKKNNKLIYKCIFQRNEEKDRIQKKLGAFCNATIIKSVENNTTKYILKKDHSDDCLNLKISKNVNINEAINDYDYFKNNCIKILENSNIYDRKTFREKFKEFYNKHKFKFEINDNKLNNIITNWQKNSLRFNKYSIFENSNDNNGNQYLREYREFYVHNNNKQKEIKYEYAIWGNSENILRISKSIIWFVDGTYHHPEGYEQLLIIMYQDVITNEKIVGLYILMNGKNYIIYNKIFESLSNF